MSRNMFFPYKDVKLPRTAEDPYMRKGASPIRWAEYRNGQRTVSPAWHPDRSPPKTTFRKMLSVSKNEESWDIQTNRSIP
jgi:hypothetical protein